MAAEDSLKQSMDKAVERYLSLFKLPSLRKVLLLLVMLCVGGGLGSTIMLHPSHNGLISGLLLGLELFVVNLAVDYFVKAFILERETIYDLRRILALSLFCWTLWFVFIFAGAVVATFVELIWWARLTLLGFSAVLIFRLTVFSSTSSISYKRLAVASLLHPFFCIIPFIIIWAETIYLNTLPVFMFFIVSPIISFVSVWVFLSFINSVGKRTLGVHSLSLFKAFMLNWVLDLNSPFEELLEKLGEERDVELFITEFVSLKTKAVMIVPSVHPGPFKNIGSSLLPYLLKTGVESEFECVTCVPHGLLGHEFDLASQLQNRRIIANAVTSLKKSRVYEVKASPFVRISDGLATACCQVFGKSVIISLTLAPKTIEDLPHELGLFIRKEAEKYGLSPCAIVNAHNSINGVANAKDSLESLRNVAAECLKKAASLQQQPFEIGAATVKPEEFSLADGMGAGGITVILLRRNHEKIAYVVIDGNNMISGLRETIISSLSSLGIGKSEVFTTDTHSVNALILTGHGYHPIGEVMDRGKLVNYIEKAALTATNDLEFAKVSCFNMSASSKVIGEKQLETLCLLIDETLQKAKKTFFPIFASSGLLLLLLLAFI
jgi:putative membrane protein